MKIQPGGTTKMARGVTPVTNTEVKQAKPKDKLYKLADVSGLQLRVKPIGAKSWLFSYFKPSPKSGTKLRFNANHERPKQPLTAMCFRFLCPKTSSNY